MNEPTSTSPQLGPCSDDGDDDGGDDDDDDDDDPHNGQISAHQAN